MMRYKMKGYLQMVNNITLQADYKIQQKNAC